MISLYNTLKRAKEEFIPLHAGKVGMYTCGPTVYDYLHIGNLRSYFFADTLRRTLEDSGYEVRLIKNITDVGHMTDDDVAQGDSGEDKVEKKAKAEKKTPAEVTAFYEEYFYRTEQALNILPAQYYPRATAHVKQMIALIEELIAKGHAYEKNGNVFFDVTSFPGYGKLSGNTLENLKVGARLEEHPDKKNPWDFALWLRNTKGQIMEWESPWSTGYPGWHIECSAMSIEYLGDTFDIHTGGEDNIFPHHEAEIAQSEGATGKEFARYFVHSRHLLVDGTKMSKSKGNFYTLEDILEKGFTPMDFRTLLLGSHYRSQMNFTWEALEQAKKNKETLFGVSERLEEAEQSKETDAFNGGDDVLAIQQAMQDDLNTPEALALALSLTKKVNALLDQGAPIDTASLNLVYAKIFFLFGLVHEKESIPKAVMKLAEERETARRAKDFAASDRLRQEIENLGYRVEDAPGGMKIRKQ